MLIGKGSGIRLSAVDWVGLFAAVFISLLPAAARGADEGTGDPLQLYSAWTNAPPRINGSLTDATNPLGSQEQGEDPGEWNDAFVRKVQLNDGSEVYLFLMNDANNLYVGVTYSLAGNSGQPNRVTLYFDQGAAGGEKDGTLTNGNE